MSQALLDYYLAIEQMSQRMLEAAELADWDAVTRHEGACSILIEQLRTLGRQQDLLPEQRKIKAKIMQRILQNDAQIRNLAEPWLANFDEAMMPSRPHLVH